MTTRFKCIATLGDPPNNQLTSSFHVAMESGLADQVLGCDSFENAIDAVRRSEAEVAMIAGAYPKIRDFIMDSTIVCFDAFVSSIPPLVAVGSQKVSPDTVRTVYLHPATIPLLGDLHIPFDVTNETSSTSAAALRAVSDNNGLAICNQLAADFYGLKVHQVLRPSLQMPFALFRQGTA